MRPPIAPVAAGVAGLAVATAIALVPAWRIEAAVTASGLPALLPAAAPPLGTTARIGLMLGLGGMVTVLLWLALTLLLSHDAVAGQPRQRPVVPDDADPAPAVRRADAHPDAPPRPPVRAARDLGTPFLDVLAPADDMIDTERSLPRDLDTPMAMFDPQALPAAPAAPPPTLRPLFRPEPAVAAPPVEPEPEASPVPTPSIEALLARLDDGLARRSGASPAATPPPAPLAPAPAPDPQVPMGLAATLDALRRMATRD